jgi:hypothetical protein
MDSAISITVGEREVIELNKIIKVVMRSKCDDYVKLKALEKISALTPQTMIANNTFIGENRGKTKSLKKVI